MNGTPALSAAQTDAAQLAELGIGANALQHISPVRVPAPTADHPRVRAAAADSDSVPATVVAAAVVDPEIPVLTIADLGVLRRVRRCDDGSVDVEITPTYSGCPALDAMGADIRRRLSDAGYHQVRVHTVLSPAWTTDDLTDEARDLLHRFGIAPPGPAAVAGPVPLSLTVRCPRCDSRRTEQTSRFSSTACKAMWVCRDCGEPFDHFKPL